MSETQTNAPAASADGANQVTQTTVGFAITVQLGDPPRNVTITAPTPADIAANGLYFSLPPDTMIQLGTLRELITWLNEQLHSAGIEVAIPTDTTDWPPFLAKIYTGVLDTSVTVNRFSVAQDPKAQGATDFPPLRLDLVVTAAPANPIPVLGLFKVVGGGIGMTRTYAGAPDTWTPISSASAQGALPSGQPALPSGQPPT